jgi:hypothetical protein
MHSKIFKFHFISNVLWPWNAWKIFRKLMWTTKCHVNKKMMKIHKKIRSFSLHICYSWNVLSIMTDFWSLSIKLCGHDGHCSEKKPHTNRSQRLLLSPYQISMQKMWWIANWDLMTARLPIHCWERIRIGTTLIVVHPRSSARRKESAKMRIYIAGRNICCVKSMQRAQRHLTHFLGLRRFFRFVMASS